MSTKESKLPKTSEVINFIKWILIIDKRKKFIFSIIILSVGLLIGEFLFIGAALYLAIALGVSTILLFFLSMRTSGEKDLHIQAFILPFVCTFAFSLFYFLAPSRMLTRITMTSVYAISLYALLLSENIFTVAANRTIALLNGARIVSFILTIISYFFLSNIIFSFRIGLIQTVLLLFVCSFLLLLHAFWTSTLTKSLRTDLLWVITLSTSLCELGFILWFWPTSPTIAALFLSGILYIAIGLSHAWLDKRLFKGVFVEYSWVLLASILILIFFTNWQGA